MIREVAAPWPGVRDERLHDGALRLDDVHEVVRGPLVEELAQGDRAEVGMPSRSIEVRLGHRGQEPAAPTPDPGDAEMVALGVSDAPVPGTNVWTVGGLDRQVLQDRAHPGPRSLANGRPGRARDRGVGGLVNEQRLHYACGDVPPAEFEAAYHQRLPATTEAA